LQFEDECIIPQNSDSLPEPGSALIYLRKKASPITLRPITTSMESLIPPTKVGLSAEMPVYQQIATTR
jgi:hypothetical protein